MSTGTTTTGRAAPAHRVLDELRVFVSSPTDVEPERDRLEQVVADVNRNFARDKGVVLRLDRWENVAPDAGRPQEVLTRELGESYTVYIGVLWARFGTPTGAEDEQGRPYLSGTKEEFDDALRRRREQGDWPAVMVYRCMRPLSPDIDLLQLGRVREFFAGFAPGGEHQGIVKPYELIEDFEREVRGDLEKVILRYAGERDGARAPASRREDTAAVVPADWEERYLARLDEDLQSIPVPHAPTNAPRSLGLNSVYIPLDLDDRSGVTTPGASEAARLLAPRKVALTGGPGSGKSTLLRHIALDLVRRRSSASNGAAATPRNGDGPDAGHPMLPIWCGLVDAMAAMRRRDLNPGELSAGCWPPVLADAVGLDEAQVRTLLGEGDVALFFDMLDEVPSREDRNALAGSIARLQQEFGPLHSPNHVIIGCRTKAWEGCEALRSFDEIRIEPLSRTKRDRYLTQWCTILWGDTAGAAVANVRDGVRASPAIARLATNPQLATMLARVAASGPLPTKRVVLYDQFVDETLRKTPLRAHGGAATLRGHLVALATAIQEQPGGAGRDVGTMRLWLARQLLRDRLQPKGEADDGDAAARLLDDLELHTGLVAVDRPSGLDVDATVRFQHQTFQEFLAACQYSRVPDVLLQRALDPAWVETLAMTAGILARDGNRRLADFLDSLLRTPPDSDTLAGEALAAWAPRVAAATACLDELAEFDVAEEMLAPVRRAHDRILPALERLEPERRTAIAEGLGSVRDPRLHPSERWVEVPEGPFLRGSSEPDAWPQEAPQTEVTVSAFRIQRWPVTVEEYRVFAEEADGYAQDAWWPDEGVAWRRRYGITAPAAWDQQRLHTNRPVVGVSWWEAVAYCRWRTEEGGAPEGCEVRLPTEAEWEKAARGPASGENAARRFPWGADWDEDRANCAPSPFGVCPVGLYPRGFSPYGLWDMAGNVAERCLDGFDEYEFFDDEDPVCESYDHGHVVRGGDCTSGPMDARVTVRYGEDRGSRSETTGFRAVAVARTLEGGT
jgi:formylglycine-generating enzyme required for sulfatase activity